MHNKDTDKEEILAQGHTEKNVDEGVNVFGGVDVNEDGIPDLAIGVPTSEDKKFGGTIGLFLGGGY